jgi:hypothetical protein
MKNIQTGFIAFLCGLLISLPLTGCTVSQAKINTVIQNIATWTPVISNDVTTLATEIASFDAADAAVIQQYLTTMQTDSDLLTTLCNQYLAAPSTSILNNIATLVSDLATTDSDAFLMVIQIKNPNSLLVAKGVLASIATAVTILSTYLATINVSITPTATQSIHQMAPYVKKVTMAKELNKAKSQGLIDKNISLQSFGF